MANQETSTELRFGLRLGPSMFAIFDAFADEAGRQTHLNGPIAKALFAAAPDLLAEPPSIEKTGSWSQASASGANRSLNFRRLRPFGARIGAGSFTTQPSSVQSPSLLSVPVSVLLTPRICYESKY
jgi:hypothetical protein